MASVVEEPTTKQRPCIVCGAMVEVALRARDGKVRCRVHDMTQASNPFEEDLEPQELCRRVEGRTIRLKRDLEGTLWEEKIDVQTLRQYNEVNGEVQVVERNRGFRWFNRAEVVDVK